MDMRTPSAAAGPLFSDGYKRWLLTLLLLIQIFNIMDRIVMSTLGQAIKIDLRITDFQLGILQGLAFSVLYAVLGLPGGAAGRTDAAHGDHLGRDRHLVGDDGAVRAGREFHAVPHLPDRRRGRRYRVRPAGRLAAGRSFPAGEARLGPCPS